MCTGGPVVFWKPWRSAIEPDGARTKHLPSRVQQAFETFAVELGNVARASNVALWQRACLANALGKRQTRNKSIKTFIIQGFGRFLRSISCQFTRIAVKPVGLPKMYCKRCLTTR